MTHFNLIHSGAQKMGIELANEKVEKLVDYLSLLQKWNKAYNLTAIRDVDQMIDRHLIDSLSTIPYIKGDNIIDVGTGPGLPGMVLAICFPEKNFTLLDSNGKKTRFLTQVKMELGMDNVTIANERVEQHAFHGVYDHVISRAFASLQDMIQWTLPLPKESGNFLAMKGVYPTEEIQRLPDTVVIEDVYKLSVTNVNEERHLVVMKREGFV
ncbi:16S rRNA (guanine(527)-N(7))-methyltransferase RsmG [Marinomonas agarivorans]|nr:16S rRNA (guanine(527)-N(7))-methyltransferase RsmG [Marinomonas agarivorans]